MEIIIQPLSACSHRCRYCSAKYIPEGYRSPSMLLDAFTKELKIKQDENLDLIFNGGDPALLGPEYFSTLDSLLKENGFNSFSFSIVSAWDSCVYNLWKIKDLSKFNKYGYTISYDCEKGTTRDHIFKEVFPFLTDIGEDVPGFIYVVTTEDYDLLLEGKYKPQLLDLIYFAKDNPKVQIKLNRCLASGAAKENNLALSLGKYLLFLSILKENLLRLDNSKDLDRVFAEQEDNYSNITNALKNLNTHCPICDNCSKMGYIGPTGVRKLNCAIELDSDYMRALTDIKLKFGCIPCIFYKVCNTCMFTRNTETKESCKLIKENESRILNCFLGDK